MKTLDDFNITTQKLWEAEGVEWREVKMSDVLEVVYRYPNFYGFTYVDNGVPILRGELIKDKGEVEVDLSKYKKIPLEISKKYPKTILREGDLVITVRGTLGKIAYITNKQEGWQISPNLIRISPIRDNLNSKFLFWFFTYLFNFYRDFSAVIPRLKASTIKNLKIPLPFRNGKPDLETQKKIVEYIEANFSIIDRILEKKKKELERLNALWESVLEQAFKPKEGEEWREMRLDEITHIESGNRPKGGVKNYTEGIPSIGGEHLNYDGTFSFEKLKYVPIDFYTQSNKGKIHKYDILIVKDGATTGKTAFIDETFPFEKAMVNEHIFLCRIIKEKIFPKYVFRFLISSNGQNRILKTKGGTAQGGINKRFSKSVKIPLPFCNSQPDLEKQKEIANFLDNVYEKIKILKKKIQKQITLLEEMKESILEEVFEHDEA